MLVVVVSSCVNGIGDHCDVVQSPRWATLHAENTANWCEKVTFSTTSNKMCLVQWHCTCGDDDKFGIGPYVFFRSHLGKSQEYVDRRWFYSHFDKKKNIGSNALQKGQSTRWPCTFLPNWWILAWSFREIGWCSISAPKGINGPLNRSPKRLSYGVFPSAKKVLEHFADSHSIPFKSRPPPYIQSWLQQYCWSTFFYSSNGSFSNAVCLGSMRCWRVRWFHDKSSHAVPNSIGLSVNTTFGLCDGSKNFDKLLSVSFKDFVLHG